MVVRRSEYDGFLENTELGLTARQIAFGEENISTCLQLGRTQSTGCEMQTLEHQEPEKAVRLEII